MSDIVEAAKVRRKLQRLREYGADYKAGLQCYAWHDWDMMVESNRLEVRLAELEEQIGD